MTKRLVFLCAALLAVCPRPASAASVTVTAPALVSGPFDVLVTARSLFAGRDPSDAIISYGFTVVTTGPASLVFLGATSGPLFDTASAAPGTDVFAAASGFGIDSLVAEPLTLATLHFNAVGAGLATISISSSPASVFQGLQFLFDPTRAPIGGTVVVSGVPVASVPEGGTLVLCGVGLLAARLLKGARFLRR